MSLPDCASVARVKRPHGVRGELAVEALTDEPDAILAPGRRVFQGTKDGELFVDPKTRLPRELHVTGLRPVKDGWLLILAEIADRTEAEKWNGRTLLAPLEELSEPDEGSVFAHELVGMAIVDADSDEPIGEVIEFYDLPQGLLLEFRGPKGVHSVPFVEEFIVEVDRGARRIRATLPVGLIDG